MCTTVTELELFFYRQFFFFISFSLLFIQIYYLNHLSKLTENKFKTKFFYKYVTKSATACLNIFSSYKYSCKQRQVIAFRYKKTLLACRIVKFMSLCEIKIKFVMLKGKKNYDVLISNAKKKFHHYFRLKKYKQKTSTRIFNYFLFIYTYVAITLRIIDTIISNLGTK